jgi:hypothetical protein
MRANNNRSHKQSPPTPTYVRIYAHIYIHTHAQYQEDPELTTCLRELAQKGGDGSNEQHIWAQSATDADDDLRKGFPELRKEWEKELEPQAKNKE